MKTGIISQKYVIPPHILVLCIYFWVLGIISLRYTLWDDFKLFKIFIFRSFRKKRTYSNSELLTHKAPRKILEQTTIYFYFLFFRENNAWHYMWIVCPADDSHLMSSIISSEKKIRKEQWFENVVCQSWLAL